MFEKLMAKRALYKAGYSSEDAEKTAGFLLSPPDGVLTLDESFFKTAPKGVGKALAKILPDSSATELRISEKGWGEKDPFASTARIVRSIVNDKLNFNTFGNRFALADVIDALPKTKIKTLSVKNAQMDVDVYKAFARSLPSSKLETLRMENTDIAERMGLIGMVDGICASPIRKLELPDNDLNSFSLGALAVSFEKGANIEELDLSFNKIGHIRLGEMCERLPESVKTLKLNDVALVTPREVKYMAECLNKSRKGLKRLEMRCSGLDERTLPELFPAFQGGYLQSVDLSGNAIGDKTALALADALKAEGCLISQTHLGDRVSEIRNTVVGRERNPVSDAALAAVNAAEKENAVKIRSIQGREQAVETVRNAGAKAEDLDVFTLAKAGRTDVLFSLNKVKPEDLKKCDADGKALIVHIAETGKVADAFKPEFWKNPKEMQETWDLLSPEHKKQMDGQNGRPLFRQVKNKVMAEFVKNTVQTRNSTLSGR